MAVFNLTIGSSSDASTVNSVGAGPNFAIVIASAPTRTIVVGDYLTDFGSNDYLITVVASQTAFTVIDHLGNGNPVTGVGSTQRAYNSLTFGLTDAEADIGNYAASGDTIEWRCYNDGTLDDAMLFNDGTLGTGGQFTLTAPSGERHDGMAGTGFVINPSGDGNVIALSSGSLPSIVMEFLEITGWSVAAGIRYAIVAGHTTISGTDTFRGCIVHDDSAGGGTLRGLETNTNKRTTTIQNMLVYDIGHIGLLIRAPNDINIQNCVVRNTGDVGISDGGSARTINIINCGLFDNGTNTSGSVITGLNNASNDAEANMPGGTGVGNLGSLASSNEFVDLTNGSENFRLQESSALVNAGTDLSSIFTRDVINNIRALNSDWDIGAFDWDEVSATIGSASGTGVTIDTVVGEAPEWTLTLSATAPADLIAGQKISDGTNDFLVRKSLDDILTVRRADFTTVVDPVTGAATTARMYDKLSTAESDISDIVEVGNGLRWKNMNDGVLDDNLIVNDTTLGESGALTITSPVGERHTGTAGTGFLINPSLDGDVILFTQFQHPKITIEFLEMTGWSGGAFVSAIYIRNSTINTERLVDSCIIHDDGTVTGTSTGVLMETDVGTIRNCLCYDISGGATSNNGIWGNGTVANEFDNNTIERCGVGILTDGSVGVAKNNACINNTTDYSGTFHADSTNNADGDGTAPATNRQTGLTAADQFKDLIDGNENYRTKGGSALRDNGADLSATFTKDIVSATRTLPFDIGVFQFTGAAGAWFPIII